MENQYVVIKPPFPSKFKEMSKEQARKYLIWFLEQIPERIAILSNYIRSFSGYEDWEANLNSTSLDVLGKWFFEQVTTRKRSQAEINTIYASSPDWFKQIAIPDYDLTIETFSLSIDIGMYLCQMMLKDIPGLSWKLGGKPKNNVDYQQPVLAGPGKLVFNPVQIVTTLAYGFAEQTKRPDRLKEVYEIWSHLLKDE